MAIPFKDLTEKESPGSAGYLKFVTLPNDEWLGALFLMDGRGEPVEFTHARLRAPSSLLWRPDDLRMHCVRSLCGAMFDTCPAVPLFILCLAEEVGPHLFSEHLRVDVPLGRVARSDIPVTLSPAESAEHAPSGGEQTDLSVYWTQAPEADSDARGLFDAVSSYAMLLEPFQRAEAGLREVYPDEVV